METKYDMSPFSPKSPTDYQPLSLKKVIIIHELFVKYTLHNIGYHTAVHPPPRAQSELIIRNSR